MKLCLHSRTGFPGGSNGKESACNAGSIPGLGRSPGEGNGNPLQYSGKSHGQRNLVAYSSWRYKESVTTERLTHTHTPGTQIRVLGPPPFLPGEKLWGRTMGDGMLRNSDLSLPLDLKFFKELSLICGVL